MTDEDRKSIIEVWKAVVEVQKHFNSIEMQIRSVFITLMLAICATLGVLFDKRPAIEIGDFKMLFAVLLPLLGVVATYLFYFMDRHWYHRLLVGAVKHAIAIEKKYAAALPDLSLSEAIGNESPVVLRNCLWRMIAWFVVSDPEYRASSPKTLRSDAKIELFYKSIILMFLLIFVVLLLFGGVTIAGRTLLNVDSTMPNICL